MTSLHNFSKWQLHRKERKILYMTVKHMKVDFRMNQLIMFICNEKCGIKLWRRNSHYENTPMVCSEPFEAIKTPLLKSHLQKAIRRKNTNLAIKTLYSLMQSDKTATLRRIPIIAIEDVFYTRIIYNSMVYYC